MITNNVIQTFVTLAGVVPEGLCPARKWAERLANPKLGGLFDEKSPAINKLASNLFRH